MIVEHDLVAALRAIPDAARGWHAQTREVRCQSCNAIAVLDAARQAQHCPFCGSAELVPYAETRPAFRPPRIPCGMTTVPSGARRSPAR